MFFFQKGIHGGTAGLYQHRHLSLPGTLGYLGMNLKFRRWCLIYRWNGLNFIHPGIPFSPDVPTLWNLRLRERLQRKRLSRYYSHTRWSIAWLLVAPHMCSVRFFWEIWMGKLDVVSSNTSSPCSPGMTTQSYANRMWILRCWYHLPFTAMVHNFIGTMRISYGHLDQFLAAGAMSRMCFLWNFHWPSFLNVSCKMWMNLDSTSKYWFY